MKKMILLCIMGLILITLSGIRVTYSKNELEKRVAERSDNPGIKEIAHITLNPKLNKHEKEAKKLWD
ncbi:MAG: hypothetical protein JXR56_03380, partial [Candidatus Cloacimonetes bacterium]|nr:hypothetical protein [Candidatus Cloacimonadota bacterium]